MKNKTIFLIFWLAVLLLMSVGCSQGQRTPVTVDTTREAQAPAVISDDTPIGQLPFVEYLGTAVDPRSGRTVEGYLIRHPRGFVSRSAEGKPEVKPKPPVSCFSFLAKGAKWKHVENWLVNPANGDGLPDSFILSNMTGDIAKWEDAADGVVGDGGYIDILGDGSLTSATLSADYFAPDGVNEVYFGVLDAKTIAITVIWGIFSGPIQNRELVEWDQVYDDAYNDWSSTGEPGKMDFENIATHELGHSCGLSDQYSSSCIDVTMYGYASNGETKKRTLEADDITGISELY